MLLIIWINANLKNLIGEFNDLKSLRTKCFIDSFMINTSKNMLTTDLNSLAIGLANYSNILILKILIN